MPKYFLLLIIFTCIHISAQTYKPQNIKSYNSVKDSIVLAKNELITQRASLYKKLDSLKSISNLLEEKIGFEMSDIVSFYSKKFGKENGIKIYNKQVWKGMTDKMLLAGWGKPEKTEKNTHKWGVFTQLYYGEITFFFKDGKLTDWEEKK